ncbi:histidine phosphatase family protein [Noviherbaspirillum aridicola]|uniref:Histidine phosphatase family protein n=1 Tax=Noviherbaspirillum aridicola TaxID=2849687 RepID=A0ABQ4Q314_9BURK|nr:histidine phosphatase family protein [Noviherbaspirillum aridicola]GIZ51416.1 histidine phosphatase family protein [Noviherbaspirillum aridicola]
MGQIYLVRHGQASFGSSNYDQLSELGVTQSKLLGQWLARQGTPFHRIIVGGMKRHRQTADACTGELNEAQIAGAEWLTEPDFNEYNHHEVLVKHRPDFEDPAEVKRFLASRPNAKHAFQEIFQVAMGRWMQGEYDADYGEPWPAFRTRCCGALQRVLDGAGKSQNILVFTSGGTIATICQQVLGLGDRQVAELNWSLVNGAVTKLFYQPGRVTLSYLNNYAHLEWLGEPGSVTYR